MSIASAHISREALSDMVQIFQSQSWTMKLHEELTELWSLCSTREQQLLLKDLILDFCMFDSCSEAKACEDFNKQIHAWGLTANNTWIVAVANTGEVDGSSAALQKLKNKVLPFETWHSRFVSNIPDSTKIIENGDNVVLFDDFIGSGKKMEKKVNWIRKILCQKNTININLYCASFCGMHAGVEHIKNNLTLPIFSAIVLKRGISDRYTGTELSNAIKTMKEIEAELGASYKSKKLTDYSFGFDRSETLYCAMNDNCPNNVFPVLWWAIKKNNIPFKTLLRRAG